MDKSINILLTLANDRKNMEQRDYVKKNLSHPNHRAVSHSHTNVRNSNYQANY